jgi:hypothetical protein
MTPNANSLWTQEQFNRVASAVYATLMIAILVGIFWWLGQLGFVTGCISAFWWMEIYRKWGGDPLNYPGDK